MTPKGNDMKVFGPEDPKVIEQMQTVIDSTRCKQAALMADNHVGYSMPIGGVVALEGQISPSCVGFDIGCGNRAVRIEDNFALNDWAKHDLPNLMDTIRGAVSIGIGSEGVDPDFLWEDPAWDIPILSELKQKAQTQLGSVGAGNHYVDLLKDYSDDSLWLAVHSGSRKLGHSTASHYIKEAGGVDGMFVPPAVIEIESDLGQEYYMAQDLCLHYAWENRKAILDRVQEAIYCDHELVIDNHHNYAEYDGPMIIHRKGATKCTTKREGFIGGSMGSPSVIFKGRYADHAPSLRSAPHGAGRKMSRREAKKTITQEEMREAVGQVVIRGGGLDEAPQAYKYLGEVLGHHRETVEIINELTPIGVVMADSR